MVTVTCWLMAIGSGSPTTRSSLDPTNTSSPSAVTDTRRSARMWSLRVPRSCGRKLSSSPEFWLALRAIIVGGLLALLALVAAACDTVPDYPNRPLAAGGANPPPADLIGSDPGAPLILIAFSGGGSRAAALGLGVLDELAAHTYPASGTPVALIDRVKVVSSVSGGSVIAAWFGLAGPARLDELKTDFLERDNTKTLEWQATDPLTLARLSLSSYTRIDALRDLLDRELFHGARFADLRRPGAPLIVMNATD